MKHQKLLLLSILAITPLVSSADLGLIVVTPAIVEQERELSPTPITVIDAEMIRKSGAKNLAEVLRGQAGVHISDLFGDGNAATIDLRGFGPTAVSNTLILIDGRRLNNSSDIAAPDISTIDLADIEQIEILQGSGGVLYGNQAVGGVINIIRKKYTDNRADVGVEVGSYDSSKIRASINRSVGNANLSILATDSSSDNYRDHNESEKRYFSFRGTHQVGKFSGYLEFATTDNFLQTPGALDQSEVDADRTQSLPVYSQDFFDAKTDVIQLGMNMEIDAKQSINIDISKRVNDVDFIQSFRTFPGSLSTQDRDTRTLAGKYIVKPKNSRGSSIVAGFNLEDTDYEVVSIFGPQPMDQSISDLFVSGNWNTSEQAVISAGVRYSNQEAESAGANFDDSVTVFSLSYTHRFDDWKMYARADQNFRYPTVEEHTSNSLNPGLKTQEGISFELGAEFYTDRDRYRVTVYSLDLDNEIAFDSSKFFSVNLDSTSRQGLILEALKQWTGKFSTNLSFTLLDAEITAGTSEGNDLPLVPERTLRLDGSYQLSQATNINLEIIVVDEQTFGGDFDNELGKLDSYEVVNATISYAVKQWQLGARINNLLDQEYSETGSLGFGFPSNFESFFPSPERNYWLSAKYLF